MPTYRYTGDAPAVFPTVQLADGSTAHPSPGDVITTAEPVDSPLLEPVKPAKTVAAEPAPTEE